MDTAGYSMDTAGRRGNPSQLETDVAECGGTWTTWRVVATDHSCLCVMMMSVGAYVIFCSIKSTWLEETRNLAVPVITDRFHFFYWRPAEKTHYCVISALTLFIVIAASRLSTSCSEYRRCYNNKSRQRQAFMKYWRTIKPVSITSLGLWTAGTQSHSSG